MRNTQTTHAGRSFRFTLALVLCAGFCLTAGGAEARPPRESDWEEVGLSRKKCKDKLIRRDSFQGIFTETNCGDFCYAHFKLPSGGETIVMCGEDEANKWYGGKNQGKIVTVHYTVKRFRNPFDAASCTLAAICAAPKKGRR